MTKLFHYISRGFKPKATYLEEQEYGRALDSLVITCVDILVVNNKSILLGKRTRDPHPDWWVIGGRMRPGESFEEAAKRNVNRELNIDISKERFKYLTFYSTAWPKRSQNKKENGSHTVSIVLFVEISDTEKMQIRPNDEYSSTKWVAPIDVLKEDKYHDAVKQCASEVLNRQQN